MHGVRALVIVTLLAGWTAVPAHAQDAAAHKAWMDDAGDLQDELREQLMSGSRDKAADAATRLEDVMAKTQAYWTARRADDIAAIAEESRALARAIAKAAKAGKLEDATAASAQMSARCNACHDKHPEKR